MIGINFHWQRTEDQKFKGTLKIMDEGKASDSNQHITPRRLFTKRDLFRNECHLIFGTPESPRGHFPQLADRTKIKSEKLTDTYRSCIQDEQQYIRWYDREDHEHFDVCADDHCQRYQGISKAYTPFVQQAIEATRGRSL